jgi:hypothetical protein
MQLLPSPLITTYKGTYKSPAETCKSSMLNVYASSQLYTLEFTANRAVEPVEGLMQEERTLHPKNARPPSREVDCKELSVQQTRVVVPL